MPVTVDQLIDAAKKGDSQARERLFERCRNYLGVLARTRVEPWMQGKFDGSDLVQQTLLEAFRAFDSFEGSTEAEWLAWLRGILTHNSQDVIRHYRTDKRAAQREWAAHGDSENGTPFEPQDDLPSPSRILMRQEDELVLTDALAQLEPDYQEVIQLRSLQKLPFEEVASRMGRTRGATQMLWARALKKLESILSNPTAD